MSITTDSKLLEVLTRLRDAGVHTALRQDRDGAVSIDVAVPGERWEVDVLSDGSVEVEVFRSDGTIAGEGELANLLRQQQELNRGEAA